MAKIDKKQYTKEQWHRIREERRKAKQQDRLEKQLAQQEPRPVPSSPVAFVLGNGISRKPIPLPSLKKHGTIYACNAVYREFEPDFLIAVDTKMILEIARNQWQNNGRVWTNYNRVYEKIPNLNFFEPAKGWSSGPTALDMASRHGHKDIFILGFDYEGINNKVNNIFADTMNYKRSVDKATYFGNWLRQTAITIEKNSQTRYIRVLGQKQGLIPPEYKQFSNLEHISTLEFMKMFDIKP